MSYAPDYVINNSPYQIYASSPDLISPEAHNLEKLLITYLTAKWLWASMKVIGSVEKRQSRQGKRPHTAPWRSYVTSPLSSSLREVVLAKVSSLEGNTSFLKLAYSPLPSCVLHSHPCH